LGRKGRRGRWRGRGFQGERIMNNRLEEPGKEKERRGKNCQDHLRKNES
jgi:hypothetical protein